MNVEFWIHLADMDLLAEFYAKLEARRSARDEEEDRKWEAKRATEKAASIADAAGLDVPATEVVITPAPEVSDEVATDALHKYVAKKGPAAAITLFAEYGAKRLGDVPSDRRAELVARMNEAMA